MKNEHIGTGESRAGKGTTGNPAVGEPPEDLIALIDKYENFDNLTVAMLNEFVEKILVHERDRKGSIETTQEIEIYFNFVPSSISAEKILEFYRLRWQVELVFKRYKSLLNLGNMPTKTEKASEVWLNGKMLTALLIEKYLGDIDFSPSWKLRKESEFVEGNQTRITFDDYKYITR